MIIFDIVVHTALFYLTGSCAYKRSFLPYEYQAFRINGRIYSDGRQSFGPYKRVKINSSGIDK